MHEYMRARNSLDRAVRLIGHGFLHLSSHEK